MLLFSFQCGGKSRPRRGVDLDCLDLGALRSGEGSSASYRRNLSAIAKRGEI
jgi:hypothetical protein